MWTRGYDVYTPTRSLVFHSYQPQPENHDINEWFKQRRDRIRTRSISRIKTSMEFKDGDTSDAAKANMGIYGIGKRRTLTQLNKFVGMDMAQGIGNEQVSVTTASRPLRLWIPLVGLCADHPKLFLFSFLNLIDDEVCQSEIRSLRSGYFANR